MGKNRLYILIGLFIIALTINLTLTTKSWTGSLGVAFIAILILKSILGKKKRKDETEEKMIR